MRSHSIKIRLRSGLKTDRRIRIHDHVRSREVSPLVLRVGGELAEVITRGDFRSIIRTMREAIAEELGILFPPVDLFVDDRLDYQAYKIMVNGSEVAAGELHTEYMLAISPSSLDSQPSGRDPIFGKPARWISPRDAEHARERGCWVYSSETILVAHLERTIRHHAHALLDREMVAVMVDSLRESRFVSGELLPSQIALAELQEILRRLLHEQVSIRNLPGILDHLWHLSKYSRDPHVLAEGLRQRLGCQISLALAERMGYIEVLILDPTLEGIFERSIVETAIGTQLCPDPTVAMLFLRKLAAVHAEATIHGADPVLLTLPSIRYHVRKLIERNFPDLHVLSCAEISPMVKVQCVGQVRVADQSFD